MKPRERRHTAEGTADQGRVEDALREWKDPGSVPMAGERGGMRTWVMLGVLMVIGMGLVSPILGHEWKDEFRDGPCQVKREATRGEFKREITCKDGVGARWRGEWKQEFWDGPCQVKIEAKRDMYKEEVTCDRDP